MRREFMKDRQAILPILICLVGFFIMLIIGAIFMIWFFFFGGAQTLGSICLLFAVPLIIMVIAAILAKRYLFGGKK
jgi:biotin transporter BioY